MNNEQKKIEAAIVPATLINQVLSYLSQHPYNEVNELITALQSNSIIKDVDELQSVLQPTEEKEDK